MRCFIVILIFFIFSSCEQVGFNSISGKYRTKGGFEWGSNLTLAKDSTFKYNEFVGGYFNEVTGTWKPAGRKIILNSYLQPGPDTTKKYYILKSYNDNSNKITIDLTYDAEALPGATGLLYRNGGIIETKWSELDGRIIFTNHSADSITITFIGLHKVVLKNNINNYFQLKMIEDNHTNALIFKNEAMKVRGNKLIDRSKHTFYFDRKFFKIE